MALDGYAVARRDLDDARAAGFDDAAEFVTENARRGNTRRVARAPSDDLQIRTANAGGLDP